MTATPYTDLANRLFLALCTNYDDVELRRMYEALLNLIYEQIESTTGTKEGD